MKLGFAVAALCCVGLWGCNSDAPLAHTAVEQKAVDDYNKMTPQQHIDAIENGPMPAAAKAAMIKQIKDQNHLN